MLAPMEITVETLQRLARLGGFAWTDAELESVPLDAIEPTTQYRML